MKVTTLRSIAIAVASQVVHLPAFAHQLYDGVCDASAAIAIGTSHFLVAEDESDVLSLYRNDSFGDGSVRHFDFSARLRTDPGRESDIEGAARIGDRIYWITSHGRNGKGKLRRNRYRLFATDVVGTSNDLELTWVGRYDHLIRDMLNAQSWANPNAPDTQRTISHLTRATRLSEKTVRDLAPKDEGLNIEGLTALPHGSGLLIGLRNPVPEGNALIVNLRNPNALVARQDSIAHFGPPIYLNLSGLGVRAMAYAPRIRKFLLIAGPAKTKGVFKLFGWEGPGGASPKLLGELKTEKGSNPEAIVVYSNNSRIQVLHDEGSKLIKGTRCKNSNEGKSFSDRWYGVD